jgi:CRP-like cAMP-binding protein
MGCGSSKVVAETALGPAAPLSPSKARESQPQTTNTPPSPVSRTVSAELPAKGPSLQPNDAVLTDLSALSPSSGEDEVHLGQKSGPNALPKVTIRCPSYAPEDYQLRKQRSIGQRRGTPAARQEKNEGSLKMGAVSPLASGDSSPVPALSIPMSREPRVLEALQSRAQMAEAIRGRANTAFNHHVSVKSPVSARLATHHHHHRRANDYQVEDEPLTIQRIMEAAVSKPDSAREHLGLAVIPKTQEVRAFLKEALRRNFVFSAVETDELEKLVDVMEPQAVAAGQVLLAKGDKPRYCWVVGPGAGSLDVETTTTRSGRKETCLVTSGFMAGEDVLIHRNEAGLSVTIKVVEPSSTLYRLDKSYFKKIVLTAAVQSFERHKNFLRECQLFKGFDAQQISKMAEACQRMSFENNERIVQEGDIGNCFYLVMSGLVRLVKEHEGEKSGPTAVASTVPTEAMVTTTFASNTPFGRGNSGGLSSVTTSTVHLDAGTAVSGSPAWSASDASCVSSGSRSNGSDSQDDSPTSVGEHGMRAGEIEIMQLGPGSHFGEQSLLTSTRRVWSAVAIGDVELLAISKQDFLSLFGSLRELFDRHYHQRLDVQVLIEKMNKQRDLELQTGVVVTSRTVLGPGTGRYLTSDGNFLGQQEEEGFESPGVPRRLDSTDKALLTSPSFYFLERNGSLSTVQDETAVNRQLTRKKSAGSSTPFNSRVQTAPCALVSPSSNGIASNRIAVKMATATSGTPLSSSSSKAFALPPLGGSHSRKSSGFPMGAEPAAPVLSFTAAAEAAAASSKALVGLCKTEAACADVEAPPTMMRRANSKESVGKGAAEKTTAKMVLSDLEIVAPLGKGAFGAVSLVKHKETGELYALKQMSKSVIAEKKQEANVVHEQRALRKLRGHPFAVHYIQSLKTDESLYFLLEYCSGGDLFGFVESTYADGRVGFKEARYYCACISATLHFMHTKLRVAYRDLKPENLLVTSEGVLKLADFGFAKALPEDGRTATFCGTCEASGIGGSTVSG